MQFSKYNRLFISKAFGRYLYNAVSNTLIELDAAHWEEVEHLRDTGECPAHIQDDGFWSLLRESHVVVEPGQEERALLERMNERRALCSDGSRLTLAVCPTLQCNFACRYCFEPGDCQGTVMSPETMAHVVRFVRGNKSAKRLQLTWYGGEPTLAFHVVRELTAQLAKLDCELEGAGILTNGYLLDSDKIALLGTLRIQSVQITLDGPEAIHDGRRALVGGEPTFRRILDNVTRLLESPYDGEVAIRINVDKENIDGVLELRDSLQQRFKGTRLTTYAAIVEGCGSSGHHSCGIDPRSWADIILELRRRGGMIPQGGFFPKRNVHSVCSANSEQGFVIGPSGELYKCWMDVGRPERIVGNVASKEPLADRERCGRYHNEADPYRDPICSKCATLPICGGGCSTKRLRMSCRGDDRSEVCSPYREHLVAYLEEYLDALQTRDICAALLTPGRAIQELRGYKVVSPQHRAPTRSL